MMNLLTGCLRESSDSETICCRLLIDCLGVYFRLRSTIGANNLNGLIYTDDAVLQVNALRQLMDLLDI